MKLCGSCNSIVNNNSYLICFTCSFPICYDCFSRHSEHNVGNNEHKLHKSSQITKEDENFYAEKITNNINEILSFIYNFKNSLNGLVAKNKEIKKASSEYSLSSQRKNVNFLKNMFCICSTIRKEMNNLNNVIESYYSSLNEVYLTPKRNHSSFFKNFKVSQMNENRDHRSLKDNFTTIKVNHDMQNGPDSNTDLKKKDREDDITKKNHRLSRSIEHSSLLKKLEDTSNLDLVRSLNLNGN